MFRFEKNEKGDFLGFLNNPYQGAKGIPIAEVNLGPMLLKNPVEKVLKTGANNKH